MPPAAREALGEKVALTVVDTLALGDCVRETRALRETAGVRERVAAALPVRLASPVAAEVLEGRGEGEALRL